MLIDALLSAPDLALGTRLRREYPADLVAAALTQHELRLSARAKFGRAMRMLFTRAGLEQSSGGQAGALSVGDGCHMMPGPHPGQCQHCQQREGDRYQIRDAGDPGHPEQSKDERAGCEDRSGDSSEMIRVTTFPALRRCIT
jgi:hypothetical protein